MERLTQRDKEGTVFYPYCFQEKTCEGAGASEKCNNCAFNEKACETLALYEDIGLTPEQLKEINQLYLAKCEEVNQLNAELERMKGQSSNAQEDLISRRAVMELIESKCTDGCLGTEDTTLIDAYGLLDDVSELSTAYDIEKVIRSIETLPEQDFLGVTHIPKTATLKKIKRGGNCELP